MTTIRDAAAQAADSMLPDVSTVDVHEGARELARGLVAYWEREDMPAAPDGTGADVWRAALEDAIVRRIERWRARPHYRLVVGERGNERGHVVDLETSDEGEARSALAVELARYGSDGWGRVEYLRPGGWDRLDSEPAKRGRQPRGVTTRRTSVVLPEELHRRLRVRCAESGTQLSAAISQAVEAWLESH